LEGSETDAEHAQIMTLALNGVLLSLLGCKEDGAAMAQQCNCGALFNFSISRVSKKVGFIEADGSLFKSCSTSRSKFQ